MDKLRAMEGFVRIVDRGSLTAAAADLDVSLPSMVRTLAALERALGVTLLNRTTRRISLTDEGRQYLEHCRAILRQVQEADAALHSRQLAPQGRLAITASVLFGRRYIAPIVGEFVRRHPAVVAELLFVDRVVDLVEEGMDAAVRIGHLAESSLVAVPLGRVRYVVCASPAYLRDHGMPRRPEDIRAHRCIRLTGLAPHGAWTFGPRKRHQVPIDAVVTCNQAETAIDLCANGFGLGFFLSYMVAPLVQAGRLRLALEAFEVEPLPVHLLYPYSRLRSRTVGAFAELCVTTLRQTRFD